jgi:hypothetical protein
MAGSPAVAAAIAASMLLAGCAETGDFGRPRATFWTQTAQPLVGGTAAQMRGETVSTGLLTDDEQELRNRAWRYLMPARNRHVFDHELGALAAARVLPGDPLGDDPARYWEALSSMPDRSPRARYQRLREDIEADRQLMGPFAAVACRVVEMDKVRMRTLASIPDPGPDVGAQAEARVAENAFVIAWVRQSWNDRVTGYKIALERLVVATPDRDAIRSERQLTAFELDRGGLDRNALDRCDARRGAVMVAPGGGPRYTPRPEKPPLPPK